MPALKTLADYEGLARFGRRLKTRRLELKFTTEELARRAGISGRAILYLEEGSREPVATTLFSLARALSVTPSYLWEGQ